MEGITGVVHREHLMPGGNDYERARKWMTQDINAAIEGALREAPDATFLINDGHAGMRNVLLDDLHDAAQLIVGPATVGNKPMCQTTGVERGFDLMFLVGHHTRAGTPGGLLSHTWSGMVVQNLQINGTIVGECAMNSATAGTFGVPTGLVTGTNRLEVEVRQTLPGDIVCVHTKETLGPTAAICKTPAVTKGLIADGAQEAVRRLRQGRLQVYAPQGPVVIDIETYRREMTDKAMHSGVVTRTGENTFQARGDSSAVALAHAWSAVVRAHDEIGSWLK
ncbi:MAG: D-amino peptidase [Kiritimatiellia bacterium]|jgi:D-amino peptidase